MYTNSILLYVNKAYLCILVRCGRVRYMILIYEKLEHVGPCERIHLNLSFYEYSCSFPQPYDIHF